MLLSAIAENFTLDIQEEEESFDLSLVAALEIDVVPHLGDLRVPDYIITQLATVLQRGSRIRDDLDCRPPSPMSPGSKSQRQSYDFEKIEKFGDVQIHEGSTQGGRFVPRERFSYWCFDLLFVICSDTAKGTHYGLSRDCSSSKPGRPARSSEKGVLSRIACSARAVQVHFGQLCRRRGSQRKPAVPASS